MNDKINYKLILTLGIILAFLIFVIAFNAGQIYKGQTEILLLAKSEKAQMGLTRIIGNIQAIPQTLSFYDKLIENNSDIEDSARSLSEDKRKKFWNSKISLKQINESSVVRIEAFDENQFQAEVITNQLTKDVILVFSRYYNIKDELEIRIIEDAIISRAYRGNFLTLSVISLLGGLILALVISWITTWIKRTFFRGEGQYDLIRKSREQLMEKGKELASFSQTLARNLREENEQREKSSMPVAEEPIYQFTPKKAEEKIKEAKKEISGPEKKIIEKSQQPIATPIPQSFSKKSGAPGNLPIADESVMKLFPSKKEKPQVAKQKEEETMEKKSEGLYREATPEEVRERLNKLLKGKF